MKLPVDPGWIGIWLLVASAVAVVVELVLMGLWSWRLGRRSRALSERLMSEQARLRADVGRLQASIAEMELRWRPYGRVLRWLRHPLAIALLQSFARRRVGAMR